MTQLLAHLWGDYILQSEWMAQNKTKQSLAALVHALLYTATFLLLTRHWQALAVIVGTHFLIDRFRLARYVIWAKNWMGAWTLEPQSEAMLRANAEGVMVNQKRLPPVPSFRVCNATGYPPSVPPWLAVWLLIIADNTLHLSINYAALRWL